MYVCVFIGGLGGFSKSQRTVVVILQVWCVYVCVFMGGEVGGFSKSQRTVVVILQVWCVYVCVFMGGGSWGGRGGIQQEPKDSSGHLTGMVCVCVHWGEGGRGDSARTKGQ